MIIPVENGISVRLRIGRRSTYCILFQFGKKIYTNLQFGSVPGTVGIETSAGGLSGTDIGDSFSYRITTEKMSSWLSLAIFSIALASVR
jgi:hypothetical protein